MASGKAFDFKLFKRLLAFTNAYRMIFYFVAFAAVVMSVLAVLRPYFLQRTIDESIVPQDPTGLIFFISVMSLANITTLCNFPSSSLIGL